MGQLVSKEANSCDFTDEGVQIFIMLQTQTRNLIGTQENGQLKVDVHMQAMHKQTDR